MTLPTCTWCHQTGHAAQACADRMAIIARMAPEYIPRADADRHADLIAERMMLYRTVKNALLGYALDHGFTFPIALRKLDPDYVE